jgi:ABC-2 type transport system ATP-binding protein
MRQRLKLALALAHEPPVLILDEPLNGLDPLARSEVLALFRDAASHGRAVLISSHVLHEVDLVADQVLMLHHGFLVAEGGIRQVREEITDRPFVVSVACDRPGALGGRALSEGLVLGARVHAGRLLAETFRLRELSDLVGRMAAGGELTVEGIDVADENVQAVYDYLIRGEEAGA